MKYTNNRFGNRRRSSKMPIVPFKDSNGETVWACRRKVYDRRLDMVHNELGTEAVVH